jgi:hypothetical protein
MPKGLYVICNGYLERGTKLADEVSYVDPNQNLLKSKKGKQFKITRGCQYRSLYFVAGDI